MGYTTSDILSSVKRKSLVPSNQSTFTNQDIIDLGNEFYFDTLCPFMMDHREEYFVDHQDTASSTSVTSIAIPTKALGGKIRDITEVDANGNITRNIPRINPQNIDTLRGIYFKGNSIYFTPENIYSPTVRISYYKRPNLMVLTSASGLITALTSTTMTISSTPSAFISGVAIDVISSSNPFLTALSSTISSIGSNIITVASTTGVAVGDYVCLSGQSVYPQIPIEYHSLLIQGIVLRILEALGDNKINIAIQRYNELKESMSNLLSPRIDGESVKPYTSTGLVNYI